MPCIVAPSSWRSTSCGLMALPTSATVAVRSTVTLPVSRSTLTSAAADADLPEDRALGVRAAALRVDAALADELAAGQPEALAR